MISSIIICSNSHRTSNFSWNLRVTSFTILIALPHLSWQHILSSVPIHLSPQVKSWLYPRPSDLIHIVLQIGCEASCHILYNPQSTINFFKQQPLTCVPIQISPQINSNSHPLSSVLIHIVLQIRREKFLTHSFQSTYHFIIYHKSII
jgi:hypothetical protein